MSMSYSQNRMGQIEVRKIGFKIENGKFRITDFDVAKGQDDFLGSVHAMIRNKDGVIETVLHAWQLHQQRRKSWKTKYDVR